MEVQKLLSEPSNILLVDDIITRGATLLGAASRLAEVFPGAEIRAFAVIRAISSENEFQHEYCPTVGKILFRESQGDTLRRP
jgi:adenine/guanine phosphoribosyltransferase-like PRPP-binding protein